MMKYENDLYASGVRFIVGVDEAGRGPLAGPVVAAAVVLPADFPDVGVDDSKKLTPKKREYLFDLIVKQSVAFGVGVVDNHTIDEINILQATKLAMRRAVEEAGANTAIGHVLVDAVFIDGLEAPQTNIIKGDTLSVSIAAASIIAKVTRDRMMCRYHETYPCYGFDRNKGYGTKAHYEGLREHGACGIHRESFLKKFKKER